MFLPVLAISHNYALDGVLPVKSHNRAQRKTQARKALLCQRFAEHRNVVACGIAAAELRHQHSTQRIRKKMHQVEAMFRWTPEGRCKGPAHSVLIQIICSSCGCPPTEVAVVIFVLVYVEKEIQQVFSWPFLNNQHFRQGAGLQIHLTFRLLRLLCGPCSAISLMKGTSEIICHLRSGTLISDLLWRWARNPDLQAVRWFEILKARIYTGSTLSTYGRPLIHLGHLSEPSSKFWFVFFF